ncbi:MAG: F0F1 ATP synthase subunit B [Oscillospiraceae bacterium]|nr:F0F1 ATP synthase subunit B [Oscillospiraceae bacterium]
MDFIVVLSGIAEELPPGRVFGFDQQLIIQIVANAINVIILAGFLAYLLYKPVRDILRKRTHKIEGQLLQAEEEMQRATELRQQYERKMEEVEREREDILGEARKFAAESSRRITTDAKQEADAIRERAAQSVKVEWERAENDMRTAIIDVSAAMAEKFVSLAINKETHDRLFNETVSDLEGMTWRD